VRNKGNSDPSGSSEESSASDFCLSVKARLRSELRTQGFLPDAENSRGITRRALLAKMQEKWPALAAPDCRFDFSEKSVFSTIFGQWELVVPKLGREAMTWLYFQICRPGTREEDWPDVLARDFAPALLPRHSSKRQPTEPVPHARLYVPHTIDGLLLGLDYFTSSTVIERRDTSDGSGTSQAEPEMLLQAEVMKPRFEELASQEPRKFKGETPYFYMSWQKVLDAQEALSHKAGMDDVLVLSNWGMITAPSYCLLRAGRTDFSAGHPTLLMRQVKLPSAQDRMELLAEWFDQTTLISPRDSTAGAAFDAFFSELKRQCPRLESKPTVAVSRVTPLLELLNAQIVPSSWIVVAGSPQYWTVRGSKACEILDAAEERASEIDDENHHSRYVIATRRGWLHRNDSHGLAGAKFFHRLGRRIRDGFNHPDQRKQRAFRKHLASRLLDSYRSVESPNTGLTDKAILDYINLGMKLELGKEAGFIPISEYQPARSRS
jgi:hypothetical protein